MLTPKLLKPRLATIVGSGELVLQQLEKLIKIFSMKRDAQVAYTASLQSINRQIDAYLQAKTGFLTEMMINFQSYLATIHHNKVILIDGYSNEVITYLINEKPYKISQSFINRVNQEEHKIEETVNSIKQMSKKLKDTLQQVHLSNANERLKQKIGEMDPKEKKTIQERFKTILQTPEQTTQQISDQLDFLGNLSAAYNETSSILIRQQTRFLQNKANNVFDNLMRVFILQLSFMKSTQFDVNNILKKIKDEQQNNRKVALEEFKSTTKSEKFYLTKYIWDKYKEFTKFNFNISESPLPINLQEKWLSAMNNFKPYLTQ